MNDPSQPEDSKPDPTLSNSEFFRLDWIAQHEGCAVKDARGRMFDRLLVMNLLVVKQGNVFLTARGRRVWKAG